MTGVRLELSNPNTYKTAQEYIEKHVAPVVTELHRLVNEALLPGSTSAESHEVDMVPAKLGSGFARLERRLEPLSKHVIFDGSAYLYVSPEVLRTKQLKVQFSANVFASHAGRVAFRLVDSFGHEVDGSRFEFDYERSDAGYFHNSVLPFGDRNHSVRPVLEHYYIEGRTVSGGALPVCRRFSLSFIYI